MSLSVSNMDFINVLAVIGKWQKLACRKSSSCHFLFSATRNVITKATEYVTFSFSFSFVGFSSSMKS